MLYQGRLPGCFKCYRLEMHSVLMLFGFLPFRRWPGFHHFLLFSHLARWNRANFHFQIRWGLVSLRNSLLSSHKISQGQWDRPLLPFPLKIFLPEAYGSDFQHFSNMYLFIKGENEDCNFTPTLPYLMQNGMHIMCHFIKNICEVASYSNVIHSVWLLIFS